MKALRLYLPLVGVPVLALVGVLRAGQRLSAPPALRGRWALDQIEREAPLSFAQPGTDCASVVAADSMHRLVITQSGPRADVEIRTADGAVWARATLQIRNGVALGALRGAPAALGCGSAGVLSLAFSGVVPDSVHATIAWPGCSACSALRALAVRRQRQPD